MAQRDHLQRRTHFSDFPDRRGIERCDAHAAPGERDHQMLRFQLAKSFANVQAVAPGFDSTRVLSARLTLPAKRFNNRDAIVTFQRALAQQLSSLATGASAMPMIVILTVAVSVPVEPSLIV